MLSCDKCKSRVVPFRMEHATRMTQLEVGGANHVDMDAYVSTKDFSNVVFSITESNSGARNTFANKPITSKESRRPPIERIPYARQ